MHRSKEESKKREELNWRLLKAKISPNSLPKTRDKRETKSYIPGVAIK